MNNEKRATSIIDTQQPGILVTGTFVVFFIFIFSGCVVTKKTTSEKQLSQSGAPVPAQQVEVKEPSPSPSNFTAHFEIYTNGTKRVFTASMYHHQSADIYIEKPDPHLIQVKKTGLTWSDFFATLPFSLSEDCLITGTKQTFCNTDTSRLYFYLNDQEVPDALNRVIEPGAMLRVEYKLR